MYKYFGKSFGSYVLFLLSWSILKHCFQMGAVCSRAYLSSHVVTAIWQPHGGRSHMELEQDLNQGPLGSQPYALPLFLMPFKSL